jgi:hypothetical protein
MMNTVNIINKLHLPISTFIAISSVTFSATAGESERLAAAASGDLTMARCSTTAVSSTSEAVAFQNSWLKDLREDARNQLAYPSPNL